MLRRYRREAERGSAGTAVLCPYDGGRRAVSGVVRA